MCPWISPSYRRLRQATQSWRKLNDLKANREKEVDDARGRADAPQIWSFLWRGTVGGVLGLFILIAYLFFFDTYRLNGLEMTALIAVGNGFLVGAVIFVLSRMLGRDLGVVMRIIAGIVFSLCPMGFVSYLVGGFYGDLKWFVSNVILLAVTLGGPSGLVAKARWSKRSELATNC